MLLLRSLLFNAFLYLFTALSSVIAMAIAMSVPRLSPAFARWWSQTWLAAYRRICNVSYQVRGREHLVEGGCVIVMKHQSTWDTFAMFAIFKEPVFVFKSELSHVPFFGWTLVRMGCIPVQRGAGKAALTSMIQGTLKARERGKQIVIFPEGTRQTIGSEPSYKSGISHLYRAIGGTFLPVALNSGRLWARRSFLRPPGVITLDILPAIPPGLARQDMQRLTVERIEAASAALLSEQKKSA